jgi:hypothetical protein
MRALEKVAQEKGLVKPEPLQKTAAAPKADLTPTTSLMENVVKLCLGLRRKGLEKEAAEVETNYLDYKQAQTLYEVSKEKGEDMINAAHPEGSHKMEDVEGDKAIFYTVLDRHLKFLDKVQKHPTGKLTEASAIIKAVKTVLGQDSAVHNYIKTNCWRAYHILEDIVKTADKEMTLFMAQHYLDNYAKWLTNPNETSIKEALSDVESLQSYVEPSMLGQGVSEQTMEELRPKFANVRKLLTDAIHSHETFTAPEEATKQPVAKTMPAQPTHAFPFLLQQQKLKNLTSKVSAWAAIGSIAQNTEASQWVKDEVAKLQEISKRYGGVDKDQEENMAPALKREIDEEYKDIAEFQSEWVNPKA